jgi:hypothetical protein
MHTRAYRRWRLVMSVAAGVPLLVVALSVAWQLVHPRSGHADAVALIAMLLVIGSTILAVASKIHLLGLARVGFCHNCGYSREGLPQDTACRECGHAPS